jgi:HEPN domain-containing protein
MDDPSTAIRSAYGLRRTLAVLKSTSVKAFLTWHDQPFRKTHSIEELGRLCTKIAPELSPAIDAAVPLTAYAWKFRYPGVADEPTQDEAERALQLARALVEAVEQLVPARSA